MGLFNTAPTLNPAQQQAVDARDGHYAVVAGPGSGKTRVLTLRYQRLIEEGVDPHDILAMTFTSKAAQEMKTRALGTKAKVQTTATLHERPHGFCTFHSLGLAFANLEREHFPFELAPQPLASAGQVTKFLGVASRRYQIPYKELSRFVSEQKRLGIDPKGVIALDFHRQQARDAYRDFDQMMKKQGLLDFDDLIFDMVQLLRTKIDVLERWQFKFVCIDECQDADELQLTLVQLLSHKHKNVFAVGDCNQAIYEWRSADPSLFLEFHKMFLGTKYIYLGQNYRSTPEIVGLVKKVAPVKNPLLDAFCSDNPSGSEPVITKYNHPNEEAERVMDAYQGGSWGTTAVLARTNAQLRVFEELCATRNVRYFNLGKSGFWAQPEIKHILSYCQVAHQPYDAAVMACLASPFHASRFINRRDLKLALVAREGQSYYEALRDYRPENEQQAKAIEGFTGFLRQTRTHSRLIAPEALQNIIRDLKAVEYYGTEEENPDNDPIENLRQLVKISSRFTGLGDFLAYCRKVTHASKRSTGLALGTCHAAKGLEFDTVFIIGAQAGLMPHEKSTNLEEEARVFFVAVSRPARHLFISYCGYPSRFLTDAGLIKKEASEAAH